MSSQLSQRAKALHSVRKELPIWPHAAEIRQQLRDRDVLLLVGETGSGKSTQVPQFLVNEPWCQARKVQISASSPELKPQRVSVGGCIAVTEPRRVAAISLARRVAAEMGTPLGSSSPASKVGYSVRFDDSTSPSTRIKFLTEGMLLQELLRDPWLRQYSAVVVDEIHERGVNVDLVAGFLRKLLAGRREGRGGVALKVVVMSATADMESLRGFFAGAYEGEVTDGGGSQGNGETTNGLSRVKTNGQVNGEEADISSDHDACSVSSWSGISDDDEPAPKRIRTSPAAKPKRKAPQEDETVEKEKVGQNVGSKTLRDHATYVKDRIGLCSIKGRQYPVQILYSPEPVSDLIDGTVRTIFQIHQGEPMPGDILVFLTGQEDIEAVEKLVVEYGAQLKPGIPKVLVRPLFAALPQHVQQEAFLPAKTPNTRKIILATNIAETSVTVSGVRYVVDGGKAKIKQFRSRLGLDSLLAKPISKSSALQRQGRAGREGEGKCYRLYTEQAYHALEQASTPEILRSDFTQTVLTIKARGVDDLASFPFMTPPPRDALEKALLHLLSLGALNPADGSISPLGQRMAKLPLTPGLSRVLLAAAEPDMDCLEETIDIISALTVENIFLNLTSEEKREEAETARRELLRREGDHLTLLTTVQRYLAEGSDRKAWAVRHFVSHRAMQAVTDVRKQLRAHCQRQKIFSANSGAEVSHGEGVVTPERAATIVKCFLKGFAAKTARLCPDGSYKTVVGSHPIAIHPSSGLFGRKVEAIVYHEYVFTNKSYAKGVSAVQMDWIGEAMGV